MYISLLLFALMLFFSFYRFFRFSNAICGSVYCVYSAGGPYGLYGEVFLVGSLSLYSREVVFYFFVGAGVGVYYHYSL